MHPCMKIVCSDCHRKIIRYGSHMDQKVSGGPLLPAVWRNLATVEPHIYTQSQRDTRSQTGHEHIVFGYSRLFSEKQKSPVKSFMSLLAFRTYGPLLRWTYQTKRLKWNVNAECASVLVVSKSYKTKHWKHFLTNVLGYRSCDRPTGSTWWTSDTR